MQITLSTQPGRSLRQLRLGDLEMTLTSDLPVQNQLLKPGFKGLFVNAYVDNEQ